MALKKLGFNKLLKIVGESKLNLLKEKACNLGYEIGKESVGFFHSVNYCKNYRSLIRYILDFERSQKETIEIEFEEKDEEYIKTALGEIIYYDGKTYINCFENEISIVEILIEGYGKTKNKSSILRWSHKSFDLKQINELLGCSKYDFKFATYFGFDIQQINNKLIVFGEGEFDIRDVVACLSFSILKTLNLDLAKIKFLDNNPLGIERTKESWRETMLSLGFIELLTNPLVNKGGIKLNKTIKSWDYFRNEIVIYSSNKFFEINEVYLQDKGQQDILVFSVSSLKEAYYFVEKAFYHFGYDKLVCKKMDVFIDEEQIGIIKLIKHGSKYFYNIVLNVYSLRMQSPNLNLEKFRDVTMKAEDNSFECKMIIKEQILNEIRPNEFIVFLNSFLNKFTFRLYEKNI